jgi:hypothetical protein
MRMEVTGTVFPFTPYVVATGGLSTPGWTQYNASFTTSSIETVVRVLFRPSTGAGLSQRNLFDDAEMFANPVCYPGDTLIRVENKATNIIENVRVDQILPDNYNVINSKQESIPILANIISGPVYRLVEFNRDLFSEGSPSRDLRLTTGHKLVLDGEEVTARYVKGGKIKKVKGTLVHTLICPTHQHIYANDTLIVAFGYDEWKKIMNYVPHTTIERYGQALDINSSANQSNGTPEVD